MLRKTLAEAGRRVEDEAYMAFLRLVASTVGQAFDRARSTERERRAAAAKRMMSETLQRPLLTTRRCGPTIRGLASVIRDELADAERGSAVPSSGS